MVKSEKTPSGYIYRANNIHNGKNYLGKTGKTIEERWSEHLEDGRALKRVREANPDKKIYGTHLDNALAKYGPDAFIVTQEDVAFSEAELNKKERHYVKEYDSMNPDRGYNMTEGGEGGRPRPEVIEKMTKVNQEIARNPETLEKMSKAISSKWQDQKYQYNVSQGVTNKWQEDKYRERQFKARIDGKREIQDKKEFLKDIQEMKKEDLNTKYDMDGKSINKRIEEMLGNHGVKNFSQAKEFLNNKNLDKILHDINERLSNQSQNFLRKKEISNKREFLEDIKKMKSKEIEKKYDMNRSTVNKRIREMLGEHGVKNYTEARNYLEDKNLDEVVKDINERMEKQSPIYEGKSIISDKREFLEDIQKMQKNEIDHKYRMDAKTINNKIKEMLGEYGVKNYTEAKDYLAGKSLDDVLKNIEQRSIEKPDDKEKKHEKTEEGQKEKGVKEPIKKPAEQQENEIQNSQESTQEGAREKLDNKSSESTESLADEHPEKPAEGPKKTEDESLPEQEEGELGTIENVSNEQPKSQAEKTPETKPNASLENSDQNISFKTSGLKPPDSGAKEGDIIIINGVEYVIKEVRPVIKKGIFFDTFQGATAGGVNRDIDGIDQINIDNQNDYNGVEDLSDSGDEDYSGLDEDIPEEGSDFEGIDDPLENDDKDYDKVAEEYSDGGESGGAA